MSMGIPAAVSVQSMYAEVLGPLGLELQMVVSHVSATIKPMSSTRPASPRNH